MILGGGSAGGRGRGLPLEARFLINGIWASAAAMVMLCVVGVDGISCLFFFGNGAATSIQAVNWKGKKKDAVASAPHFQG